LYKYGAQIDPLGPPLAFGFPDALAGDF